MVGWRHWDREIILGDLNMGNFLEAVLRGPFIRGSTVAVL